MPRLEFDSSIIFASPSSCHVTPGGSWVVSSRARSSVTTSPSGRPCAPAVTLIARWRSSRSMTAGPSAVIGLAAAPLADVLLEFVDRSYDRGSRRREIWARVRGSDVLLLDTDNAQRFGQIYRALQRALDQVREETYA